MEEKAQEQQKSIENQAEEIFKLINENAATPIAYQIISEFREYPCSGDNSSIPITLSNTTNAMIKYF